LIGASEKIRKYKEELKKAGGITAEVANNQLKSFSSQMIILKNDIVNAAEALGETLVPKIEKIATTIREWTKAFQELPPETKQFIGDALMLLAVIGPGLKIVGKAITAIAAIKLNASPIGLFAKVLIGTTLIVGKLGKTIWDWKAASDDAASTKDWLANQTPIEELKKRVAEQSKLIAQAEKAKSISSSAKASSNLVASVFNPTEEDKKAGVQFQDSLSKAVFDQLNTEGKINKLIEERAAIAKNIASTQKGSQAYWDAKGEALKNEISQLEMRDQRAQEIKDVAGKQAEQANQFAGAVEAGSVEDYRLRIRAGGKDAKEEIAKKQEKELVALNKKMAESIDILRRGFETATGQNLQEVTII